MRHRLDVLVDRLRTGFWAIPTLCVLVAVLLALGLVRVDRTFSSDRGITFGAGPDGAREVLSAITTSMITFTGLVFSITIVVLQLTSSQFSPRVLRTFLRDRQTQLSLGVFIATFVYAVLVLRTVRGQDDESFVPALATTVGVLLLLVSVGVFVAYIHHIATAIQVSSILASIGDETRRTIDRELPAGSRTSSAVPRPRDVPVVVVVSRRAGVLTTIDTAALVRAAGVAEGVLVSDVPAGGFVPEGAPLVALHGGVAQALDETACRRAFTLERERTMQSDLGFGFRQLADIAARALSPGVNDPTTAVQALDQAHDLLRRLATRPLPTGVHTDEQGRVRLHLPAPQFADFLALALDEADQYGEQSGQVQRRIDDLLADLRDVAPPEHRPVIDARIAARP